MRIKYGRWSIWISLELLNRFLTRTVVNLRLYIRMIMWGWRWLIVSKWKVIPLKLECFIEIAKTLLVLTLKYYLRTDQRTKFTEGCTTEVLNKLGAELRQACPGTPEHNGIAERTNAKLQRKAWATMFDLRPTQNKWDSAIGTAVYRCDRISRKGSDGNPIAKIESRCSDKCRPTKRVQLCWLHENSAEDCTYV